MVLRTFGRTHLRILVQREDFNLPNRARLEVLALQGGENVNHHSVL